MKSRGIFYNLGPGLILAVLFLSIFTINGYGEVHSLSSGSGRISFRITVPPPRLVPAGKDGIRVLLEGYGSFSPPGAIELPGRTFRLAIPPGVSPGLSYTVMESSDLGELEIARVSGEKMIQNEDGTVSYRSFMPPDPWEDKNLPPPVRTGEPGYMGHQRVLPIEVSPLQISSGGRVTLVREISLRVSYNRTPDEMGSADGLIQKPSKAWQRLYRNTLVNPGDVSRFIRPLKQRRVRESGFQAEKRLKIRIPETGIYSIRADSLISAGMSVGLTTGFFSLRQYYYDESEPDLLRSEEIPILIDEGENGVEGIFDSNDRLIFYARGIKDDPDAGDTEAAFTDYNVAWLEEEVPGSIMGEGPELPDTAGYQSPQYRAVKKLRDDSFFLKYPIPNTTDFYFISSMPGGRSVQLPLQIEEPAGEGDFSLTVTLQWFNVTSPQNINFEISNSGGTREMGSGILDVEEKKSFTFQGLDVDWLVDGTNQLIITSNIRTGFLVDEVRIDYHSRWVARDNSLEFEYGPSISDREYNIEGFATDSGCLIDVTDPENPTCNELTAEYFQQEGESYTLNIYLPAGERRHFIVIGEDGAAELPLSHVSLHLPAHLKEQGGPYNSLVITHPRFRSRLSEYVSWREDQGYRILTATVGQIYDEFNGGRPHCRAIKRFIQYGFDYWGVEFVLLAGDASEDHKRVFTRDSPYTSSDGSGEDFVPSYTYCPRVSSSVKDEVVASDKWYTFLDVEGQDRLPDVFIGRIPVGEEIELRAYLNKLYSFEEPGVSQSWRRRIVLMADDAWSINGDYRYNAYENQFRYGMDTVAVRIEEALPGGFDIDKKYLSYVTDQFHPNQTEHGAYVHTRSRDSTRAYYTPRLVRSLNEGALFLAFQGHAMRRGLTSEGAFMTGAEYDDQDSLRVFGLQHIFLGFGCHINEFAKAKEMDFVYDGPNGDCFSEQLMVKAGAGAIAAYASYTFEYLDQNKRLCNTFHRMLFQEPPSDSIGPANRYTGAHWTLGEAFTGAEIEHMGTSTYGYNQVFRYQLLGDPMTGIDTGPPLMAMEVDWGSGWRSVEPGSLRAEDGSNRGKFRFTASDVVALGGVGLEVDGRDWTDSLTITVNPEDEGKTFARRYAAEFEHTLSLEDQYFLFRVFGVNDSITGRLEYPVTTAVSMFYGEDFEVTPTVEAPPSGTYTIRVKFPIYIDSSPSLLLDGKLFEEGELAQSAGDSRSWESEFSTSFQPGEHVFTVEVGEYREDFMFTVAGERVVLETFCFPNPFKEGTNIVYTLNQRVESGRLNIYNVSGVKIRSFRLDGRGVDAASYIRPHSIYWDGRDFTGEAVANGTYIYLLKVNRGSSEYQIKGKSVKLE